MTRQASTLALTIYLLHSRDQIWLPDSIHSGFHCRSAVRKPCTWIALLIPGSCLCPQMTSSRMECACLAAASNLDQSPVSLALNRSRHTMLQAWYFFVRAVVCIVIFMLMAQLGESYLTACTHHAAIAMPALSIATVLSTMHAFLNLVRAASELWQLPCWYAVNCTCRTRTYTRN